MRALSQKALVSADGGGREFAWHLSGFVFSQNVVMRSVDPGLLVMRLYFGLALAFAHGINKLPPSDRFVAGVVEMGFPMPMFFAWASTVAELGGGLLVAIGLATRPAAVLIIINMLVATFIRQAGDPFGERELALAYLAAAIALLLAGAGRYSIDAMLRNRAR